MTWELFCAKADMAQAQGDLVRPCMGKAFCLHWLLAFIEKKITANLSQLKVL